MSIDCATRTVSGEVEWPDSLCHVPGRPARHHTYVSAPDRRDSIYTWILNTTLWTGDGYVT